MLQQGETEVLVKQSYISIILSVISIVMRSKDKALVIVNFTYEIKRVGSEKNELACVDL